VLAAAVIAFVAQGQPGFDAETATFAANGYGAHSPGQFELGAALVTEFVMTFMFLFIILGATDTRAPAGFAPIAIGLTLALIHLISIPITNTSVNPARSTSQALFAGGWALEQLWLFWVAPVLGGVIGGLAYKSLTSESTAASAPPISAPTTPQAAE
jgi:aquaporin Z